MTSGFKIGSTISIVGIVALVGLYIYLNSKIGDLERGKNRLEREIVTRDAENDSLLGLGTYIITDTLWGDSIPVPYPVHDTLPPGIIYVPIPWVRGSITIDTFKTFGPDYDPLSIRVTGKFYFPEQEPDTNWLKIVPEFKNQSRPAENQPKTRSYAIGLGIALKTSQGAYIGLQGRFRRTSLGLTYDPWHKTALMTVGFDIWGF